MADNPDSVKFMQTEDQYGRLVIVIGRLTFEQTCPACPEQYDVWLGERQEQVGYVRLRWGQIRADYPDCMERTVYEVPYGDSDLVGGFDTDTDRMEHLTAIAAVLEGVLADGR